jgi:fermentation-respiration switch protein FrsA (DUF1100 family)
MIHGTSDRVVHYSLGKALYAACANPQEFLTVPNAGHNNLETVAGIVYHRTLARWLSME